MISAAAPAAASATSQDRGPRFGIVAHATPPVADRHRPRGRFASTAGGVGRGLGGRPGAARLRPVDSDGAGTAFDVPADALTIGARTAIAIRPESLQLSPAGPVEPVPGDANVLHAELREVAFLGDRYRYELTCAGIDLVAQGPRAIPRGSVSVSVPPEACVVVSGAGSEQRGQSAPPLASMVG